MSLQDWSNLAQVIGALAVVISLVYVGFQVKRNTSAVRSATSQAVHNNYADWYMSMVGDAELNRIAIKGLKDYSSLDEIEKARFIETFMAFTAYSQNVFYQWRKSHCLPGFGSAGSCSCGESHHDEEATSRSQAPGCFQDRRTGTWVSIIFTTPRLVRSIR